MAELGFAVSDNYKNKAGELVEQTCFVEVVVWGPQAESIGEYLRKGSPALIEGRLQFDQWENQQGEKRSKLRVRADRVQFLGSRKSENSEHGGEDDSHDAHVSTPSAPPDPVEENDENLPF